MSAAGLSNTAVSPTYGDASQFPDDPNTPGLEDIIYSDDEDVVSVEADFNNLESSIPASLKERLMKDFLLDNLCFQDNLDAKKAGEEVDQSYMLFLVWSYVGSTNTQNNAEDADFDGNEHDFDAKGKSTIESVTGYRDLNAEFQDCSKNKRLENIIYSDDEDIVGAEAVFNNLESSIPEEPKRVHQALKDPSWIKAMQEELL
nr:hypothetical protein [Tanacetum cinerariifolium]